jgi:Bacterial RNA polymerase, alpha chain C terminal domain
MSLNDVYRDRYYKAGCVYIAGSLSGRVIKIGTTKKIGRYPKYLQTRKYGSLDDWEILYCFWVNEGAGRIEHDARGRLQQQKTMRMYEKDGRWQKGREILKCSFSAALVALADAVGDDTKSNEWRSNLCRYYEFGRYRPGSISQNDLVSEAAPPQPREKVPFSNIFLINVGELELSVRSATGLKNDNIIYIGDLVQKTDAEILRTPNFGRKSLTEIKDVLAQIGLRLGVELSDWPPENVEELAKRFQTIFFKKVDELELSVRTANCLKNDNVIYIGDLVQKSEEEMLRTPNFGRKSLNEIMGVLAQMGLHLGMEIPCWPPENVEELSSALNQQYPLLG